MADLVSTTTHAGAIDPANVTSTAVASGECIISVDTLLNPTSSGVELTRSAVEMSAAIERAKLQLFDYLADLA